MRRPQYTHHPEIRDELMRLVRYCELKLRGHDADRKHWSESGDDHLDWLDCEVGEFREAIEKRQSKREIWLEAADVANLAMMAASVATGGG